MVKKLISIVVLIVLITQIIFPSTVNAINKSDVVNEIDATTETNIVSNEDNELEITGDGSFGTLLADSIDEQTIQDNENNKAGIIKAEIDESNVATVKYFTYEEATIIVSIYNEEKNKLITTGKIDVDIAEQETEITIQLLEELPEYFFLKVFIVNKEKNPLCSAYENPMYTEEMQKLLTMTTDDYDPDRVLNIDDSKETNFAIYNDETIIVRAKESGVTLKSADNENNIYVFENINDQIRNLKNGDIISYVIDDEHEIIVKVSNIEITENTASISGGKLNIEEVFDYIKIEADMENSKVEVEEFETEGLKYNGMKSENESVTTLRASYGMSLGENSEEFSFTFMDFPKTDNQEENDETIKIGPIEVEGSGKISGEVTAKISETFTFYQAITESYIEYNDESEMEANISATGKVSLSTPLVNGIDIKIPKENPKITIKYVPKFKITVSVETKFSVNYTSGQILKISGEKVEKTIKPANINLGNNDIFDNTSDKIIIFIGLDWNPKFEIKLSKRVTLFSASTDLNMGAQLIINLLMGEKYTDSYIHDCDICFTGKIDFVFNISFEFNFLENFKKSYNWEYNKKLKDFYFSITHNEFGWGICPHKNFLVTLKVIDKDGNSVENAEVEITSYNDDIFTKQNGELEVYLSCGTYIVTAKSENRVSIKKITVKNDAITEILRLGENLNIDENTKISQQGACGENARYILYDNGVLYIDGTGSLYDLNGHSAFDSYTIKKIVINEGITSLGNYYFYKQNTLTEVILPNSLEKINDYAFAKCDSLQNIIIPNSVKTIGFCAFSECGTLQNVIISNSVKRIEGNAFSYTSSLQEVSIPKNIEYIGSYAFYNSGVQSVIIPESCMEIGLMAFAGCKATYVSVASKNIGEKAFNSCQFIDTLEIKKSVEKIEPYAFAQCNFSNIIFEDGLKNIGEKAFYESNGSSVEKMDLSIPSSVEKIESQAFFQFKNLNQVTIASKEIGEEAFKNSSIESLEILSSVEKIGNSAFFEAIDVFYGNLTINNGVKYIGENAFSGCIIKTIDLPKSVLEIGPYAFAYINLGSYTSDSSNGCVTIRNGKIGNFAFARLNIMNLVLKEGITESGDNAFEECSISGGGIEGGKVIIPASVKYIGNSIFWCSHNLKEIWFVGDMPEFEESGFLGYHIEKVYYPNKWVSIPNEESFYVNIDNNYRIEWIPYDVNNLEGMDETENKENIQNIEETEISSIKSFNFKVNNLLSRYEGTSESVENAENVNLKESKFTGLIANENYIIYVIKNENVTDILSNENLLYIDQATANEKGEISFIYIPKEETENMIVLLYGKEKEQTCLIGDINGDEKINIKDWNMLYRYINETIEFDENQLERADINGDGKVNIKDWNRLYNHITEVDPLL